MFHNGLKSKLDAVCSELAAYAAETPENDRLGGGESGVSYRATQKSNWWPSGLGSPTSVGGQNDLRYAVFSRRLVIKDGDRVEVYDTGNDRIFGVAQAQSFDQTLAFTSQDGLVSVKDLPGFSFNGRFPFAGLCVSSTATFRTPGFQHVAIGIPTVPGRSYSLRQRCGFHSQRTHKTG